MEYIFLILALALLVYVFTRKFDFFSVGAICYIIYHFHMIYGIVFIASHEKVGVNLYYATIDTALYIVVYLQLLLMFVSIFIYDHLNLNKHHLTTISKRNQNVLAINKSFLLIGILSLSFFLYDIYKIGFSNLTGNKSEVWDNISVFYIFTMWSALAVFTYSVKNKKYGLLLLSVPQVVTHLFIGSRAYFAAMVIVFLILYRDKLRGSMQANIRTYIFGGLGLLGIMVYKKIYTYVKAFDFQSVMLILADKETYLWVLRFGEPRIVLANYNYIISTNFRLEFEDIIARFISVIPFANKFVSPPNGLLLSNIFIENFNSTYGLASNFWAEGYAMFGYIGIFVFYMLWILSLLLGNILLDSQKWSKYFMIPILAYFSFYIHRMDFVKVIGNIKFLFFAMLIWIIINSLVMNYWKVKIVRYVKIPRIKSKYF